MLEFTNYDVFELFLSLKILFMAAKSVDPDEMPHSVAFNLGLPFLPTYRFRGFPAHKGLIWVSHVNKVWILISWLHLKQTDLVLHC